MSDESIEFIRHYLQSAFRGVNVEHWHDFDRRTETFRVLIKDGSALLRVSSEFVDDNSPQEIGRLFDLWSLASILENDRALGVLVTNDGLSTFTR